MTSSPQPRPVQTWNAEGYSANAHFVSPLGQPVLDLLQPRTGERIWRHSQRQKSTTRVN